MLLDVLLPIQRHVVQVRPRLAGRPDIRVRGYRNDPENPEDDQEEHYHSDDGNALRSMWPGGAIGYVLNGASRRNSRIFGHSHDDLAT